MHKKGIFLLQPIQSPLIEPPSELCLSNPGAGGGGGGGLGWKKNSPAFSRGEAGPPFWYPPPLGRELEKLPGSLPRDVPAAKQSSGLLSTTLFIKSALTKTMTMLSVPPKTKHPNHLLTRSRAWLEAGHRRLHMPPRSPARPEGESGRCRETFPLPPGKHSIAKGGGGCHKLTPPLACPTAPRLGKGKDKHKP